MNWLEHGRKPMFWTDDDIREYVPKGFDAYGDKATQIAADAYEYVNGLEGDSNYIHNLKTVIVNKYVAYSDLGLLASAIPYYNRYVERCEEENRRRAVARKEAENSEYLGAVGDRVKGIRIVGAKCIWSGYDQFGEHYLYKMLTENNNVLIWSTGKGLPDGEFMLDGTIKELKEYNGVKETVMTRCKMKGVA